MKYFSLREMTKSDTARRLGIDNTPSDSIKKNLTLFINTILDPIREDWGGPISISSGYRCPELNAKVGGAKTSGHLYGFCADLQVKGGMKRVRELADFIFEWMKDHHMKFDELLFERSGNVTWLYL